MSLAEVWTFEVGGDIVTRTEEALRAAGRDGYELFVLWSGRQSGQTFRVETPHVPKQTSYQLDSGLCVRVEGEELHRLNVWLFDAKQTLGVQVHAHPTDAFHSDTDDAYPIVASLGGLSIVVPDFCRGGLFSAGTAMYRLTDDGWIEQPSDVVSVL
jgi:hypothetical protein